MTNLLPVDTNESLGRDPRSQAIVNADTNAFRAFLERKQKQRDEDRRKQELEARVDELTKRLEELECRFQRLEQNSATTA